MKLTNILENIGENKITEAIEDYEFYIGTDKKVHTIRSNKEISAVTVPEFQAWLKKVYPGNFQKIWQALTTQKKFSGKGAPEDMTIGGQVSQGVGD